MMIFFDVGSIAYIICIQPFVLHGTVLIRHLCRTISATIKSVLFVTVVRYNHIQPRQAAACRDQALRPREQLHSHSRHRKHCWKSLVNFYVTTWLLFQTLLPWTKPESGVNSRGTVFFMLQQFLATAFQTRESVTTSSVKVAGASEWPCISPLLRSVWSCNGQ